MSEVPSGARLWLLLWKTYHAMERCDRESIRHLAMCPSDFAVLEVLLHKGPLPVNDIGRRVLLTSGSITTAVDRLANRGFVRRTEDPNDGRVAIVRLTPAGERLIAGAFAEHAARMEKPVETLSAKERKQLSQLLKKLGRSAEKTISEPAKSS